MSYPDPPSLSTNYTAKEQALGDGSFPGQELDTDLTELRDAYIALLNFVKGITRSDGKLANASVMPETLGPGITLNFEPPTAWAAAVNYTVGQTVFETDAFYICVAVHTSSVFANDLASGRWDLLVDFADVASDAANSAAAAAASEATAILKASEAATSASAAAASATTATTKASEASTSASAAAASATTATTKASEASTDAGTASAAAATATTKASEAAASAALAATFDPNDFYTKVQSDALVLAPVRSTAVNDTALPTDRGRVIRCTAALTLTLTSAATLGNGWFVDVIADGGAVTTSSGETIDGAAAVTIPDGMTARIHCDGTAFYTTAMPKYTTSLASSGYKIFPTGLILQWFQVTVGTGVNVTTSLPITFPNAVFGVVTNYIFDTGNASVGSSYVAQVRQQTVSQVILRNLGPANATFNVWVWGH